MLVRIKGVKPALLLIAVNLAVLLFLSAICEVGFSYLYKRPERIPTQLLDLFRTYYYNLDRKTIQFLPECSRYDDALFYTLRTGECQFSNAEFHNS